MIGGGCMLHWETQPLCGEQACVKGYIKGYAKDFLAMNHFPVTEPLTPCFCYQVIKHTILNRQIATVYFQSSWWNYSSQQCRQWIYK
jgi:hypothetical protein